MSHRSDARRLNEADIENELESYSRRPFQTILAKVLDSEPKPAKLQAFSNKYPDRWAQTAAIFGRLAGYSEKVEVANTSVLLVVKNSSDSELLAKIQEIELRLKQLQQPISDAEIVQASENQKEIDSKV